MTMIAADPINQKWQEYMAPLIGVGSGVRDGSAIYVDEGFHVD